MDLQAILNASDSSDEDYSNGPLSSYNNSVPSANTLLFPRGNGGSVHVDLEQILNEDDSSVDSTDIVLSSKLGKFNNKKFSAGSHPLTFPETTTGPINLGRANDYTNNKGISIVTNRPNLEHSGNRFIENLSSSNATSTHNPEDWAVLQSILHEDEDDDDDLSDKDPSMNFLSGGSAQEFLSTRRNQHTVEATTYIDEINLDDEEDLDFMTSLPPTLSQATKRIPIQQESDFTVRYPPKNYSGAKDADARSSSAHVPSHAFESTTTSRPGESDLRSGSDKQQQQRNDAAVDRNFSQEVTSRRSFDYALNSERKLLRSGHREIISPLMVKRRLKPRIELSARGSVPKNRSVNNKNQRAQRSIDRLRSTPSSVASRYNFSGIVENKVMTGVSKQLVKHADAKTSKVLCGLPTCLAFNSKFIAVGTQLGIILIFDLFEVLRQRLGASTHDENWTGGKIAGSITSIDLSQNGEAVVAGYTSGGIVLWDTIRGVVLRSVSDVHVSPITAVRFLTELKIVTVDAGGLVNKLTFTKNILWSNYSMEPECLLDGTAGQILAMNVASPFAAVKLPVRPIAFSKVLGKLTLMALSSERSSFVVAVEPKVNVLHRWARPPVDRTDPLVGSELVQSGKIYLPCLAWGWALTSGGGNVVMPTLARAWGCCLQLLCASFPTLDEIDAPNPGSEPIIHWPAFGVHDEVDASTPIVAIDWLNDRTLAYLTETNELTLVDTVMMTLLERLDFSGVNLVFAEFALSRGARKESTSADDTASCMVFQNSTRCSDDRLLVLCQDELLCISIVGARRRISALEADGEWLEALAFALDHYESTVLSQEDRKRDPNAKKDLARHPEFSVAKSDEEEWIAKLLLRYLNLAVENAPVASIPDSRRPNSPEVGQRIDLAQSHYQMLCGVACEFCLSIRRIDLLFGPIFRKFQSVGYTNVFLDVLEPYVLNDKLSYMAPEVMSLFVEHCKAINGIATVERCLLHMDCTIMDFDSILALLRRNEMFTALFYVFNQGLDDYVTPFEILLERVFDEADAGATLSTRDKDGFLRNDFERLGYKAIVYLHTCFKGESFPREKIIEPDERQQSLKVELLSFLLQQQFSPSAHVKRAAKSSLVSGQRSLAYPYIRLLLNVDPWCSLDSITTALDSLNESFLSRERTESLGDWVDGGSTGAISSDRVPSSQTMIDVLSSIILPKPSSAALSEINVLQSRGTMKAFLEFSSKFLMNGIVKMDKSTTFLILKHKSNQFASAKDAEGRRTAQQHIMSLLSSLPRDSYDPDQVLEIFDQSQMHRASLLLHQQVASSWHDSAWDDIELRTRHFLSAIDCYLGDDDISFRKEVFYYVKKECSGVAEKIDSIEKASPKTLRDAVFTKLSSLVLLDSRMTATLVADLFAEELDEVIDALDANDGGEGQFLFLQAVISGERDFADPVVGSVLIVSTEHHQRYLNLLARLHPEMVYEYLSTHDSYKNEESLLLCQHYDIADATAYLLERMGNVSSALQLILQTLESRLMNLKRVVRGLGIDAIRRQSSLRFDVGRRTSLDPAVLTSKHEGDAEGVTRILTVALDLCERNSETSASYTSDTTKFTRGELWFNVLDRLINAKGFLRLSKEQPEHAKMMGGVLSDLLRLTMQRMVSSVPLTDLVRKVTSDHSSSRIGELREMVESLLATYGFELKLFESAVTAFHFDVQAIQRSQHSLQVRANPVREVMNLSLERQHSLKSGTRAHDSDILRVGGNGDASFVVSERMSGGRKSETGLVNALSRLRGRRQCNDAKADTSHRLADLSMMTLAEQLHKESEIDPVVYDRFSGVLGEAEHIGRLMMFQ